MVRHQEDFLKDVFITESEYDKLRSLVLRKKNIILQGAPVVGKTYSAKRLAYSIIGEKTRAVSVWCSSIRIIHMRISSWDIARMTAADLSFKAVYSITSVSNVSRSVISRE